MQQPDTAAAYSTQGLPVLIQYGCLFGLHAKFSSPTSSGALKLMTGFAYFSHFPLNLTHLAGRMPVGLAIWLVAGLAGWLGYRLPIWLAGWLAGWLADWLAG